MRNGDKKVFEMGYRRMVVEGDSSVVIQILGGKFRVYGLSVVLLKILRNFLVTVV